MILKKNRKSPSQSATLYEEGTIEWGNDNKLWVVKKNKNSTKRWIAYHCAEIFGYTPLTAKILKKNINKPIIVFERAFKYNFPKKRSDFDVKYCFTPSGDAELYKKNEIKIFNNWLKNKNYIVKENDIFIITGTMKSKDIDATLQVSPNPSELVSTNLMNTQAFIKI
mgnify:CR=1 FL=1|tara:strand:- start:8870 stop:9370 length:501 start_codon:yes stop_codon:yes gene_type:complete